NPTHIFTAPGTYDVIFVVIDSSTCNITDTAHVLINVPVLIPIVPAINVVSSPVCDTLWATGAFTGSGGNVYQWNFGDGFKANGPNASHVYSDTGTFNIT